MVRLWVWRIAGAALQWSTGLLPLLQGPEPLVPRRDRSLCGGCEPPGRGQLAANREVLRGRAGQPQQLAAQGQVAEPFAARPRRAAAAGRALGIHRALTALRGPPRPPRALHGPSGGPRRAFRGIQGAPEGSVGPCGALWGNQGAPEGPAGLPGALEGPTAPKALCGLTKKCFQLLFKLKGS